MAESPHDWRVGVTKVSCSGTWLTFVANLVYVYIFHWSGFQSRTMQSWKIKKLWSSPAPRRSLLPNPKTTRRFRFESKSQHNYRQIYHLISVSTLREKNWKIYSDWLLRRGLTKTMRRQRISKCFSHPEDWLTWVKICLTERQTQDSLNLDLFCIPLALSVLDTNPLLSPTVNKHMWQQTSYK